MTQFEKGNCAGCEYREKIRTGDTVCNFYLLNLRKIRTDEGGNCIENTKKKMEGKYAEEILHESYNG